MTHPIIDIFCGTKKYRVVYIDSMIIGGTASSLENPHMVHPSCSQSELCVPFEDLHHLPVMRSVHGSFDLISSFNRWSSTSAFWRQRKQ